MKTNCELPLCMLRKNTQLNDIDFVLFHLYISSERYRKYYDRCRAKFHRLMILDCSAYEFFVMHKTLDEERFEQAIINLKPDYYILPDTLMNDARTIIDSIGFLGEHGKKISEATEGKSKPMAVIQGNSIEDFRLCIDIYKHHQIDAIAIPFHNSFFKEHGSDREYDFIKNCGIDRMDDDIRYAAGRMEVVTYMMTDLMAFDYVHLLGSHCPYEKTYYSDVIKSMDTGYPVKNGYSGKKLSDPKSDIIIDDFLNEQLSDQQIQNIMNNIMEFKSL